MRESLDTREIRLTGRGLTQLPPEVFDHADTLELLDVSGNQLDALPDDLHRFQRLRILFASSNRFTALPRVLGACPRLEMVGFKSNAIADVPAEALPPRLRWLILTDNAIDALPAAIGQRPQLQKLMLAGNRLTMLPDSLQDAPALELLRIAANRFDRLPGWLPALPRLAWLAWGGNPATAARESAVLQAGDVSAIDAHALDVGERLGEGASGVIHAARWHRGDADETPVALKRFKGQVTSDGWPHSEMAASLAAGPHDGLIPVHGPLRQPPQAAPALVLGRVPPHFTPMAAPPSFDSCTRDVYPPQMRLGAGDVAALAQRVAGAMAQLHARGLVHGDLYAHNLLWDGGRTALLGDFGAASFLPAAQPALHAALRALDLRAFGVLLGEWLARADGAAPGVLARWRDACLHGSAQAAGGFAGMAHQLSTI